MKVTHAPWSLFEERLCGEFALYIGGTGEITAKRVPDLYNKLVVLIKNNSVQLPKVEMINSELEKIDHKDSAVERFLKRLFRKDDGYKEKIEQ